MGFPACIFCVNERCKGDKTINGQPILDNPIFLSCNHGVCTCCLQNLLHCPVCRTKINPTDIHSCDMMIEVCAWFASNSSLLESLSDTDPTHSSAVHANGQGEKAEKTDWESYHIPLSARGSNSNNNSSLPNLPDGRRFYFGYSPTSITKSPSMPMLPPPPPLSSSSSPAAFPATPPYAPSSPSSSSTSVSPEITVTSVPSVPSPSLVKSSSHQRMLTRKKSKSFLHTVKKKWTNFPDDDSSKSKDSSSTITSISEGEEDSDEGELSLSEFLASTPENKRSSSPVEDNEDVSDNNKSTGVSIPRINIKMVQAVHARSTNNNNSSSNNNNSPDCAPSSPSGQRKSASFASYTTTRAPALTISGDSGAELKRSVPLLKIRKFVPTKTRDNLFGTMTKSLSEPEPLSKGNKHKDSPMFHSSSIEYIASTWGNKKTSNEAQWEATTKHGKMLRMHEGWNLELGTDAQSSRDLEDSHVGRRWYKDFFFNKEHFVCIGGTMEEPMLVAIEHTKKQTAQKALILSKEGYQREWVYGSSLEQYLHSLRKIMDGKYKNMAFTEVKRPGVKNDMVAFEERSENRNFKFGLLYAKRGQTTEADVFGNPSSDSDEFDNFVNCIATKIDLRGWKDFAGGLRTDGVSDGYFSYYNHFREFEIMFHTSTLLPYTPGDPQQLDRKRHIGNDIVLLVWSEGGSTFEPNFIRSHFIHVVIVVSPAGKTVDGQTRYKIEVAAKSVVPPFGPYIQNNEEFVLGPGLSEFLLTKLVNAECAAMRSAPFKEMLVAPRRLFLRELLNTYGV